MPSPLRAVSNRSEYLIELAHLGWSQHRAGLDLYEGNDPTEPRDARRVLLEATHLQDAEGATVLLVVLPGRFSDNTKVSAAAVAMITALRGLPDEEKP